MDTTRFARRVSTLLIMTGLFLPQCWPQEPIKISFPQRKLSTPELLKSLKRGDFFIIEIDSINLNLFKVSIGKTDSTVNKPLTVPSFASFGISDVTSVSSSLSPIGGLVASIVANLQKAEPKAIAAGSTLRATGRLSLGEIVQAQKDSTTREIMAVKELIDAAQSIIRKDCDKFQSLQQSLGETIFNYNRLFVISALDIPARTDANQNKPGHEVSNLSVIDLYDSLGHSLQELNGLRWDVDGHSRGYDDGIRPYLADLQTDTWMKPLKPAHDSIVRSFNELEKMVAAARDSLTSDNTLSYLKRLAAAANNSNTTYRSLPLQFNGDLESITVSVVPQSLTSSLQAYNTQIIFPIDKTEFWGVSTGFYLGLLKNNSYSFKQNVSSGTDTVYELNDEKPAYLEFGFNAMLRYGRSLCGSDSWYWQAGIGPGIALSDKVRPRMLVGLGLAYGREEHKIVIDIIGEVFGYTNYLSNTYTVGGYYRTLPGGVTVSKLRNALSLSVSYLFY